MTTENSTFGIQLSEAINHNNSSQNLPITRNSQTANPPLLQAILNIAKRARQFFFIFAYFKISLSLYVLSVDKQSCSMPLKSWLLIMMLYDSMVIAARFLRPNEEGNTQESSTNRNNEPQGYSMARNDSQEDDDLEEGTRLNEANRASNNSNNQMILNQAQRKKLLDFLIKTSPWLYIFLFFMGCGFLMSDSSAECEENAPLAYKLVKYYFLFQSLYLTMVFSIVFLLMIVCVCACVLGIGRGIRNHFRRNIVTKSLINQLQVHKYPLELSGDPECSICLCDYENGDNLIQFTCSKMHHFHADCIKKWLLVNDVCPICRMKLKDMKKK